MKAMKTMKTLAVILGLVLFCGGAAFCHAADTVKQPVFLLCPHKARLSAWSLYFLVDANDHSKVLGLGLDELTKKNSVDCDSYENVVAAAQDPKTARKEIGKLDAAQFGKGQIEVEKDDALKAGVTLLDDNKYRLMVSLRIAADLRFTIGGKEQDRRDVVVVYDKASKTWKSQVRLLKDSEGNLLDTAKGKETTGILFKVTPTGIYEIVGAIVNGDSVRLLDR